MSITVFPPPVPPNWNDPNGTISTAAWKWCHRIYLALSRIGAAPSGALSAYAGSTAPDGWLLCDGSAVSRTTYADLFEAIGTTFGVGDGSTTFNLPDARGRTFIGAGTGSGLTARTLGQTTGTETHQLVTSELPAHTHTIAHTHNIAIDDGGGGGTTTRPAQTSTSNGSVNYATQGSSTANSGSSGSDGAHNNMQPSLVMNYIIKY